MTEPTDAPPIWFLDIDGVLNAVSWSHPDNMTYLIGKASPDGGQRHFTITYDEKVIDKIRELHESEVVEVVWLTTWREAANEDIRELFGFPEFVVCPDFDDAEEDGSFYSWWKFRAIRKFIKDNPRARYVWTDDDLAMEPEAMDWAWQNQVYALAPKLSTGLTMKELEAIEKYIKGLPHS